MKNIKLEQGYFAVHNKYDPGNIENLFNYCYVLKGQIYDTQDDTLKRIYQPLYPILDMPKDFQGFMRLDKVFLECIEMGGEQKPRFKFFENRILLKNFLLESRAGFASAKYSW